MAGHSRVKLLLGFVFFVRNFWLMKLWVLNLSSFAGKTLRLIFGFIHFSCILKRHYFARAMKKKLCWILGHLETVGYCLRSLHLIVTNAIIDCFFEAF